MIRLSISNIAWPAGENEVVFSAMGEFGFTGLEIAPTSIWGDLGRITKTDLSDFKEQVNRHGISIVAMQSLLYGHPEMTIFDDQGKRAETLAHLKRCVDIGAELGVKAYVFGSPKNRCLPPSANRETQDIAVEFFHAIGSYAHDHSGEFCIEPNPSSYGTNFINSTLEALSFVEHVNTPGLKINVDTGTIIENQEEYESLLKRSIDLIGHVHVSEPYLAPIDSSRPEHPGLARVLKSEGYSQCVSIEMKKASETACIEYVRDALGYVSRLYR